MQAVDHTDRVISASQQLMKLALDMETGVRGYLIAGDEQFLQPYNEAKSIVDSQFESLNQLVADNPSRQSRLAAIRGRFEQWRTSAERAIELRRSGASGGDQALLRKQLMDSVRAEHEAFVAAEERLRDERVQTARHEARLLTAACLLLSLGIGVMLAVFTRRRMHLLAGEFQKSLNLAEARAEEQKKAQAELGRSKERLELAAEVAGLGEWELDLKELTAFRSLRHDQIFGYKSLLEEWSYEMFLDHVLPEHRAEVDGTFKASFAKGSWDFETRIRRVDGEVRWIWARGRGSLDETGQPARMFGTVTDITERKQVEEQLRQINRTLKALSNSNQALLHATGEPGLLQEVCRIISEDCGHAMVWIGFAEDDEDKTVRPVASAGFDESYLENLRVTWADSERGRGPAGTAIRTGRHAMCRNMQEDPACLPWREEAVERGYGALVALPLMDGEKTVGAITIYSRMPDAFSDEEVSLLTELADDLSHGIVTLRLRAAHAQAEEALRESQAQFRTLADAIPQLCWIADADGFIFWYNQRWYEYTGTTPEQMEGWGWQSVHHPDTLPNVLERWKASISTGEPFDMVFPLRGADGVFRPFLTRVMPVRDAEGKVARWFGTNTDISEQKRAEERVKHLASFPEKNSSPIFETDLAGKIIYANAAAQQIPDLLEAGAGNPALKDWASVLKSLQASGKQSMVREIDFGGSIFLQTIHYLPELKVARAYFGDITERRQAEMALQESEERYRNLFTTMHEGFCVIEVIFDADEKPVDYRFLQVNPAFEAQTGLHEAEGKLMRELAPAHEAHWFEIYGRIAATGKPAHFINEARALNRWYHVHAYRIGEPELRRVAIIFNDISDYKQAEQALRSSEQRWATTLKSIGDAVISTDAVGNVDFMNEVAERLTGWSLAEAEGKELSAAFSIMQEITRIVPESPVAKVLRSGKVVGLANHTVLIHRDGSEIPIEDSAAPIRNRSGQIEGVVLVFHDVLEQRRAEKALRISDRLATTGRLAATIAHEIHNPLDAVSNLLYLISHGTQEELTRQYASTASGELVRITQMTQRMLAFQREAAKPVPVKIGEILESVAALYERKINSAKISLKQQIEFDGDILALPGELRQMFANLVGNAIEAVAPRGGTITVRAYTSCDWRRERPGLRVIVADDGPGIPAEVRAKIFEPFFTTKGESGTGLGLWIATEILRKYDGTLHLRTRTEPWMSGTCFSIFLPYGTEDENVEVAEVSTPT